MKTLADRAKDLIDTGDSTMKKIDMSSEAITRRLRQTEQLRILSLSPIKAKKFPREKQKR